ncbi:hypothetical protein GLOTRDRAFT_123719 [Gloeophyllum trabeum ATCC 11539]|uniref:F-box domain-containing protein n=1 Tax=Gloeophyllum trabeum (strain ATCC 11539 / FP-39264 / Madison 617) TaxID=670483 RepID=S7QKZ8_GLOTA|nr:uncharacterized protein GLOTRDRAFT_123719 [Gloeophyllum trabeum ATCC 11539]EPQ59963.1 hypothetical protein GLOTRDRAFT_123719 [Gloeophyllum trabeum ATCC 11539]
MLKLKFKKVDDLWTVIPSGTKSLTKHSSSQSRDAFNHNSVCPPNQLPPEILGNIFQLALGNDYSDSVISITHVCRYWRDVALGDPSLWRKPASSCPELVTLITQRSKNLGLDLVINTVLRDGIRSRDYFPTSYNYEHAMECKLAYVAHAASLTLVVHDKMDGFPSYVMQNLRTKAPLLESLTIGTMEVKVPLNLTSLQSYFPRLSRLTISRLVFSRTSGMFGSLTCLDVCSNDGRKVMDALQGAPLLKKLILRSSMSSPCKADKDAVARLPHLEEFCMRGLSPSMCIDFLSHLIVGRPVSLILRCDHDNTEPAQMSSAAEVAWRFLTANHRTVYRFAEVHAGDDIVCILRPLPPAPGVTHNPATTHFRIDLDQGRAYLQEWHHYLPLGDVEVLRVHEHMLARRDLPDCWETTGLANKFKYMNQVECLEITDNVAQHLIPHLATKARPSDPGHPALFPRLQRIHLYMEETRRILYCEEEGVVDIYEGVFDVMESYVNERQREGDEIAELWIHALPVTLQSDALDARFRGLVRQLRFSHSRMETSSCPDFSRGQ